MALKGIDEIVGQSAGAAREVSRVFLAVDQGEVQALILAEGLRASTPVVRDGKASAELELTLTGNAVSSRFLLQVAARRAGTMLATGVAEVRIPSSGLVAQDLGGQALVDFGVLRTLGGLGLVEPEEGGGASVSHVQPWVGNGFGDPVWSRSTGGSRTTSFAEVLTERVLVTLTEPTALDDLRARLYVTLPEAPAGLELSLDGGTPIWSHPDAVVPGDDEGPPVEGAWNAEGLRLVDVAEPLSELLSDPDDPAERTVRVTLTSRVPGLLGLDVAEAEVDRVDRVALPSGETHEMPFQEEGRTLLRLPLPGAPAPGAGRRIRAVHLTVAGEPPRERVLEPVDGPVSPDVELEADPDHVFAVRVAEGHGLERISGVRLPLAVGPDGAEARVSLYEGDGDGPGPALEGGVSEPVLLDARTGAAWTTFPLPEPVDVPAAAVLWVALIPSRGLVVEPVLDVGPAGAAERPWSDQHLRRRLHGERWSPLPTPFRPGGSMEGIRGRVRLVGTGPTDRPVAPLLLSLEGASGAPLPVVPVRGGVRVTVEPAAPVEPGPDVEGGLVLVSRARGPVTLRDVEVVWSPVPAT